MAKSQRKAPLSSSLHAGRHVEQRDRCERIPAAAAGALPEMRGAREPAIDATVALRPAQDARETQRQVRALLRRELPRIARDGADDFAETRILAQQIRQAIAHEWLLLQACDDPGVGELCARGRFR